MRFRQIFACLHVAVQLGVHIGFIEEGPVENLMLRFRNRSLS